MKIKRLLAGILSLSLVFSSAVSSISAESDLPLAGNILGYVFDEMGTVINSFDDNSIILTKSNIGMNYDDYVAVLSPDGNLNIYQKTDIVRSFVSLKPGADVSKINKLLSEYDVGKTDVLLPERNTRLVKVSESGDIYMLWTILQDINEIYDIIKSDADVLSIYERKQINKVDGHLYYLMINSPESKEEIIKNFDMLKLEWKSSPFRAEGSDRLKDWKHSFVFGNYENSPETYEQIAQLYSKYDDFELTFWVSTEEEGSSSVYFSDSSTVYSSEASVPGDINSDGTVDVSDLTELSLALLGDAEFTPLQQNAADVDYDGEVKLTDLAKLKQYISKQVDSLGTVTPEKISGETELLRQKYPEYFELETAKGIEVYAWRGMGDKFCSVLMEGTNRNKETEEIAELPPVTCEEAKMILDYYGIEKDNVMIIPLGLTGNKKLGFDVDEETAEIIKKYFNNDFLVSITDLTVRDGMTTASALEKFYEDDEYTYSFGSIKSEYIECTFKDGSKLNIRTALEKGLVNISDLDVSGILYLKEEVNKPNLNNPLNKFFSDNDLQAYAEATVFETVETDIDRDGTPEKCTLSTGPTSGLYTVIISAYSDGTLKYRNTISLDHYAHTTITEADGVLYLKRYNEYPEEVQLNKLYIENNRITVDDLTEYEWYWGGPQYNKDITLINIENTADRNGHGLADAEEVFFKDDKYTYIFPAIQSEYVECTFSDGSRINIVDALELGDVSVTDLKKFDILYYMEDEDGNFISSRDT